MATDSLRPFAGFSRYMCNAKVDHVDTSWVLRRYNPSDLRSTAPVPRFKLQANTIATDNTRLSPPSHWVPQPEAPLRSFSRASEERRGGFSSSSSTRSEEWSTLRQMLPSRGWSLARRPPRWGADTTDAPSATETKQFRFPHTNSPMTK